VFFQGILRDYLRMQNKSYKEYLLEMLEEDTMGDWGMTAAMQHMLKVRILTFTPFPTLLCV